MFSVGVVVGPGDGKQILGLRRPVFKFHSPSCDDLKEMT